ncbi:MAG: PDZ domain-containing protein [Verrucomicrobia bacterium]|nr:PDZ domain-containing protein [Verrucomicrobiota bacterium]
MKSKLSLITAFSLILSSLVAPLTNAQSNVKEVTEEVEMVTFLGVETSRVSNALRNHIDIPDGVGLTIDHVAEGSSAEKAGLQQYDILLNLNDQIIINQEQLSTLIQSKKPGDTVKIEVLRKAKKLNFKVKLGEKEATKYHRFRHNLKMPFMPQHSMPAKGHWDFNFNMEEFGKRMEEFVEHAAEMGNKALQYLPEIIIEREEEDGTKRITTIGKGQKRVSIAHENLIATMETKDGKKHYTISEKDGEKVETLYEGEELTEDEIAKFPDNVQAIIKRLQDMKTFGWESMGNINSKNIRVIINTGKEEARAPEPPTSEDDA